MSNVLIGIIGVILFIGLALAGALFLGPRFQEATQNSKAAAAVQSVSQVANAVELYEVQEGRRFAAGSSQPLIDAGYLKTSVANPLNPVWAVDTRTLAGVSGTGDAGVAAIAGLAGDQNAKICAAIARQSGQTLKADGSAPEAGPALPNTTQGCFVNTGQWGGLDPTYFIVYRKVR
jgi:hypothetical protein